MELTDHAWPALNVADGNWYIFVICDGEISRTNTGPYISHSDAIEAIQIMSYRLRQGWKP